VDALNRVVGTRFDVYRDEDARERALADRPKGQMLVDLLRVTVFAISRADLLFAGDREREGRATALSPSIIT
jgi:hypothetical protein